MTPTRFYCWLHEQRYLWPGLRRWQPKPDQSFPLGIVLVAPVLCALPALAVALLVRVQAGAVLPVFLLGVLGLLLFSVALAHFGFVALAWNQRAAKLRAGSVTAPVRPPIWALVVLGLPYFLLISVVTPVALILGIENLRGAMAWREARAALVARGERLTFAELLPPPVPAEQNTANLPAFAGLFAYTQTNRGPIVWVDTNAMGRFRVLQLPDQHLPKRKDNPAFARRLGPCVSHQHFEPGREGAEGRPDGAGLPGRTHQRELGAGGANRARCRRSVPPGHLRRRATALRALSGPLRRRLQCPAAAPRAGEVNHPPRRPAPGGEARRG
jgi:hypothetical protein